MFRRLSAVTRNRKQRVAASAAPSQDMEVDDGGSKISRALTIIFLIHIVAIGLIFVHQRFLDGRPVEVTDAGGASVSATASAVAPVQPRRTNLPRLSTGDKAYVVQVGDNYERIATAEGVDEGDLRLLNKHVDIGPGLILKIPPKRIVAEDPPEVVAIRSQTPVEADHGLVPAVDVSNAPRAQLVRPNVASVPSTPLALSGQTHTVQSGDSIWRIANRFKVSQDELMRANGITDARKMKIGMKLVIPQP
jgi:LysM repeat protein